MKLFTKFIILILLLSFSSVVFVQSAEFTFRGNILSFPEGGTINNTDTDIINMRNNVNISGNLSVNDLTVRSPSSIFIGGPNFATINAQALNASIPGLNLTRITIVVNRDFALIGNYPVMQLMGNLNLNSSANASSLLVATNSANRGLVLQKFSPNYIEPNRGTLGNANGDMFITSKNDLNHTMIFGFFDDVIRLSDGSIIGLANETRVIEIQNSLQSNPFLTTFFFDLNISGNFTVNNGVTFPHRESLEAINDSVRMFCKSDNNCYIKLSNGDERRLLDLPSGIGNFSEGSILFMGPNNTISEDNLNFFWNDTSNRMGIGIQDSIHPLHIFDPQTIMAKFESSNAGAVGIQVSSGVEGGDAYIRFTEGNESEDWIIGLDDTANRFFIENSVIPTDNSPFVILTNGDVGIGTSTPDSKLTVNGDVALNEELFIPTSGNVGIGTVAPSSKLQVDGNVSINGNTIINSAATSGTVLEVRGDFLDTGRILHVYSNNSDGLPRTIVEIHNDNPASSSTIALRIQQDSSSDILNLFSGTAEVFTVVATGNVGIGTITPEQLLHVGQGNIEIDPSFTIGSLDGFNVGALSGFIDFGIKKDGFENRFSGMRVEEIQIGPSDDLFGTLIFFTDAENTDFSTERMRITGLGNVGIGTSNPTEKLQVEGNIFANGNVVINGTGGIIDLISSDGSIEITRFGGIPFIDFKNNNSEDFDFRIQQTGNNSLNFESSNTASILFLDGLGNVGIGTVSPNFPLDVRGIVSISAGSARIELEDTGVAGADWWILPSTGGNVDRFRIYDAGAAQDRLVIDGTGNIGIGTSTPIAKLNVIGNVRVNGTGGAIDLSSSDGSIEISRLAGSAFIDFKNVNTEDFDFRINQDGVNSLNFQSSNSPTILFLGGLGNVGIGTTTPEGKLNVIGDLNVTGDVTADTIFDDTIFAQLSSSVDQIPVSTNPEVITYNIQDDINRITHSTSVNPGELTITVTGTYLISAQPQVSKDSGGGKVDFDMFLQVDRNGTFIKEANTNIKLTIKDSDITDVIVSALTVQLDAGEKIRMMQKTSAIGVGMGLKNSDPTADVPRTPSIIFTMYRIGG